jgi:hypothetical protein
VKPRLVAFFCVLTLSGCAHPKTWEKPGAGVDEFNQAKYACLQQVQQPYSAAYVGRYGGSASGGITTNMGLYNACMEAGGWALIDNDYANSPTYVAAIKEINEDARAMCRKQELYAYYSWAPCRVREATAEQLADRTRVTPSEKPAFNKAKAEIDTINARIIAVHRQYNEKHGNALATNIEQGMTGSDRVRQEYLDGRITRGEYNKRRRDIAVEMDAEAIRIIRGN